MKTSNETIKMIIGLGNPSKEYQYTYHNVGNMALDYISGDAVFETPSKKHFQFTKISDISVNQHFHQRKSVSGLILIKPLTFMNDSGQAVKEALSYFKIRPENLLIAHDDSDMILGNYKLAFDQRSAGHKGVQSIIDAIGTQRFLRIKIGIRPEKEPARKKAEEFVLKKINKKDFIILENVFEKIGSEIKNLT